MKSIKEIDTTTKEGKHLLIALAALTVSPQINIGGTERNGRLMEPDDVLQEISKVVDEVYLTPNQGTETPVR